MSEDSLEECWKAACNNVLASMNETLWKYGLLNEMNVLDREIKRLRDAGYPPADKEFVLKHGPCSIKMVP